MRRLARLLTARRVAALAATLAITLPGLAAANTSFVTITFDSGYFDPNPPVGTDGTPDHYEAGAIAAGFWWDDAGTPAASINPLPHTHIEFDNESFSLVAVPHSWRDALQGLRISLADDSPFSVVSVDYRLERRDPPPNQAFALRRLPWSYALDDVQLILAENPSPATPDFVTFESQWSTFSIDDGSVLDLGGGLTDPLQPAASTMWQTMPITGLDDVTQFYISHTGAAVMIDNIVLSVPDGGSGIPEPSTAVLLGLGLGIIGARERSKRRARA